jgi:predicted RNA-binding protein
MWLNANLDKGEITNVINDVLMVVQKQYNILAWDIFTFPFW